MKAFHEVRNYNSDLMVWFSGYDNINFVAHWHKEIELIYVRSGTARFHITDQSYLASAGDLVICESGQIHYSDSCEASNHLDFLIFDTNLISSRFQNAHFLSPFVTAEQLKDYGLELPVKHLLDLVSRELGERKPYYKDIVKAAINEFWFRMKRQLPREPHNSHGHNHRQHMLGEFQGLIDYIDLHFIENFSLESAASMMHFSTSYFSKTFKKLMGMNYVTYVNMVRVEHAVSLLNQGNKKITEIAMECGFNNIRSFNRVFKEITGYTPTEFVELDDPELYKTTYYNRKSNETEFVENDSLTVRRNFT